MEPTSFSSLFEFKASTIQDTHSANGLCKDDDCDDEMSIYC